MHYKAIIFSLIIMLSLSSIPFVDASGGPKDRIDFWQNNYEELSPDSYPLAEEAHQIFEKVLQAAGSKPGVIPRLYLLKRDPGGVPLALSIPDGSIIISRGVLDICYYEKQWGDDRLAFIFGHELAHQLKDDFWHIRFFDALGCLQDTDSGHAEVWSEIKDIAELTDKVLSKELQADEYGIVYSLMAGFNPEAIISQQSDGGFFEFWVKMVAPEQLEGSFRDLTHPSPMQRAETVKARLTQVVEKTDLFRVGLYFYQAEMYEEAILAFKEFLRFFPSREVYHNLATCHHQAAIEYFNMFAADEEDIPLKLSLTIDPVTEAEKITLRNTGDNPEATFNYHINQAIDFYEQAILLDPLYKYSYNNLGCAYLLNGDNYKAVGILQDAYKIDSGYVDCISNLGAAFYSVNDIQKARKFMNLALEINPEYSTAIYNLGKIEYDSGDTVLAKSLWKDYLESDQSNSWSRFITETFGSLGDETPSIQERSGRENLFGLEAGYYEEDIPKDWGTPVKSRAVSLGEEEYSLREYSNKITVVLKGDEVYLLVAKDGYTGESAQGIGIKSTRDEILASYGAPSKIQSMSQNECWIYNKARLTLIMQDDEVVSWIIYM
jgi:tetratricopeptide (TPR) repeat protein